MTIATWAIEEVRPGTIRLWHGLLANIPYGYVLCDGANNTPDLRSSFVKGAAAGQNPGATGGAATHQHTSDGGHTHGSPITTSTFAATLKLGTSTANSSTAGHSHTVTVASDGAHQHNAASNEPVYYAVAFIMKT